MSMFLDFLIQQEKFLCENDELKDKLQQMFADADKAGNLKPFVKDELVQARPANDGEEVSITWEGESHHKVKASKHDFVIRDAENTNQVKIQAKQKFEKDFEIENAEEEADAEGFLTYRPKGQILAFQYTDHEQLKLKDEHGHTVNVKYGDYLGYPIDDESTLIQLDKTHFEEKYRLAE